MFTFCTETAETFYRDFLNRNCGDFLHRLSAIVLVTKEFLAMMALTSGP